MPRGVLWKPGRGGGGGGCRGREVQEVGCRGKNIGFCDSPRPSAHGTPVQMKQHRLEKRRQPVFSA